MRILIIFFIFLSFNLSSSGGVCGEYLSNDGLHKGVCDQVNIDPTDKASLQRGLNLYVNYCFGCHSLKYARYSRISMDLGIPEDLFKENLLFGDQKIGDLMTIGMKEENSEDWFGVTPPDLTLETSLKGADWVYTYLKSFYIDPDRSLGVNNKVYINSAMPNVLIDLQGEQQSVCKEIPLVADNGGLKQDPLSGEILNELKCGFLETKAGSGELTKEEFNLSMRDLTNFLAYMADPIKEKREYIGVYVILYLLLFTILSYLLYREFKKDIH